MRSSLSLLAAVGTALLTLSGCAGAVLTDQPARIAPAAHVSRAPDAATANRAAAERDAADLLKRLRLPPSATPVGFEPASDHGYLKASAELLDDAARATAHAWATIDEPPSELIAYLNAHPPAGSSQSGTGAIGNGDTHTLASEVMFAWPPVGNVLGYRELQVTVTSLGNGESGILAQAQSDWVVLRSWRERVPPGVTTVRVRLQRAPRRIGLKKLGRLSQTLITIPRVVARTVSLVDSLAVVQPIELMCPMEGFPAGALTVTYSAAPAGPALAQATVPLFPGGRDGGGGECDPITFSIRGHAQTALVGGSFAQEIEQLAGFGK
jgi:hypothetical protein